VLEALALVAAAGTSFVINFFVLERLVFARLDG
jgi:hypothetical protein